MPNLGTPVLSDGEDPTHPALPEGGTVDQDPEPENPGHAEDITTAMSMITLLDKDGNPVDSSLDADTVPEIQWTPSGDPVIATGELYRPPA